ncbi:MAG: glycosyltransferase family 4 protein [Deltaproteobacteria bacterium]|nr:glycosyltransferase family 4 protein [Deltaproteobacteria bacterium]
MRRKILFLFPSSSMGGEQRWLATLAPRLDRLGFEVRIIFNRGHRSDFFYHLLEKYAIPEACYWAPDWRHFHERYPEVIAEALAAYRPDVLIVDRAEALHDVFKQPQLDYKPKVVFVCHTMEMAMINQIRQIDELIDEVVAVSNRIAELIDWRPVHVIWNGVEKPQAIPGFDVRKLLGIPERAEVVGFMGRVDANKRPSWVIEAAKRCGYWSLIIGRGAIVPKLKEMAATTTKFIPTEVWFPGNWYQAMTRFVLASMHEGFGLVPIEALLYDVPVYVTRVGDLPNIFGDTIRYFDSLQELIGLLRQSPYDIRPARAIIEEKLSPERMAKAYARLFEGQASYP